MKTSEIIEKNKKSIILIDVLIPIENNQFKRSIRGTGFIVSSDGKFVTCAHLYKQISESDLQYLGVGVPSKTDDSKITHYNRYNIKLLKINEQEDLALMQIIPKSDKESFKVISGFGNSESLHEGDEILFIGYPLATEFLNMRFGITMSTSHCIVSSIKRRKTDGSLHFFMTDTHINNGSSGSPVFLKETGEVIGVASGKISAKIPASDGKIFDIPANMGICRPAKYAVNLINQ